MKILSQSEFTLSLVEDLGMLPIGGLRSDNEKQRTARFCTLQCKCGVVFNTRVDIGKRAKSCKTCSARKAGIKHGDAKTKLYAIWQQIKNRCGTAKYYKTITFYSPWESYDVFKIWALSSGYKEGLELDRINQKGNYEPKNCRWTTRQVQGRNTRLLFSHNTTGYRGVAYCKSRTSKNKYLSSIKVNNQSITLGWFDNPLDAAKAYDTYVVSNNLEHTINGVLYETLQPQRVT